MAAVRRIGLIQVLVGACLFSAGAMAQGVFTPMTGSAPAATGPNSINPSAGPSSTNPNAHNPSAAPSAIATPNALNPSGTPSTFAPQIANPNGPTVVPRPVTIPHRTTKPRSRTTRTVRGRTQAAPARASGRRPAPPRPEAVRRANERARNIMGSVCRGC